MATTLGFKDLIDKPEWRPLAVGLNAHAAGISLAADLRNDLTRHPEIFQLASAAILNAFNPANDGWSFLNTPGLTGTFGAGAGCIFMPSRGPCGTLAAGGTTTSVVLSTALPAAVGLNQLANRGDGVGFRIRIIGNQGAGSSGKTEERTIIANTLGTMPTLILDSALSFTPQNGDAYEILSGRLYMLSSGTLAAGCWKYYDVATRFFSGNLSTTNLAGTLSTDASFVPLDELHVPYDQTPGGGFFGQLISTAIAAGTITGQAASGDAVVVANEYRNFQIRVVEDTTNKTAVGQRRLIASHTAGASPVYTLGSNWTVNPSVGAKYVIELPNQILLFSSGTGTTYTYNPTPLSQANGTNTIAADAWHTTYFAARGFNMGAGCTSFGSWGIEPDSARNARHSFIYSFRGGAALTLDLLDIAGGTTGAWTNGITYNGQQTAITTGNCGKYAPADNQGRYGYMILNATGNFYRFDVKNRTMEAWAQIRYAQTGTAAVGDRVAVIAFVDGATKVSVVHFLSHLAANFFDILAQR